MTADEDRTAVYVAWGTFKNTLDQLAQGIPNRIDRSAFPGYAWSVQSQLIAGMKFLGLINADGTPTASLIEVSAPEEALRKEALGKVLRERYAALFALDLTKVTLNQLEETITASYSATGTTRLKAVRFFLSAVEYAGIPVSRFLKPAAGKGGPSPSSTTPRRRRSRHQGDSFALPDDAPGEEHSPSGTSRVVRLRSGGALTLSSSVGVFALHPDDRTLVFQLIDLLDAYEAARAADGDEDEDG